MQSNRSSIHSTNPRGQFTSTFLYDYFESPGNQWNFDLPKPMQTSTTNSRVSPAYFDQSFSSSSSSSSSSSTTRTPATMTTAAFSGQAKSSSSSADMGRPKPRFVKVRKQFVSARGKSIPISECISDSGFKPFCLETDQRRVLPDLPPHGFSSNLNKQEKFIGQTESSVFGNVFDEGFVFGLNSSNGVQEKDFKNQDSASTKNVSSNGNEVLSETSSHGNFVFGSNNRGLRKSDLCTAKIITETDIPSSTLPDEIRKMSLGNELKEVRPSASVSNSNVIENPFDRISRGEENIFVFGNVGKGTFVSGQRMKMGFNENLDKLPDEMRRMNIESKPVYNVASNSGCGVAFTSQSFVSGKETLTCDKNHNTASSDILNKLPDELKKMNLGKEQVHGFKDDIFQFGQSGKEDSCLRRNFTIDSNETIISKLPHEMGKLNIYEKCESNENLATELPEEMNKLNISKSSSDDSEATPSSVNINGIGSNCDWESDNGNFLFGGKCRESSTYIQNASSGIPIEIRKVNTTASDRGVERAKEESDSSVNPEINNVFVFGDTKNAISSLEGFKSTILHETTKQNNDGGSQMNQFTFHDGKQSELGSDFSEKLSDTFKQDEDCMSSFKPSTCTNLHAIGKGPNDSGFSFNNTREEDGATYMSFQTRKPHHSLNSKENPFDDLYQRLGFTDKKGAIRDARSQKRKGKMNKIVQVPKMGFQESCFSEEKNIFGDNAEPESPGNYSPMDFSPYEQTLVTEKNESVCMESKDENLANADRPFKIDDTTEQEKLHEHPNCSEKSMDTGEVSEKSISDHLDDAEIFRVASDINDISNSVQFSFSSNSDTTNNSNFTFTASSSLKDPPLVTKRHFRRKSRIKSNPDSYNVIPNAQNPLTSTSNQLFPDSGFSPQPPEQNQKGFVFVPHNMAFDKSDKIKTQDVRQETNVASPVTLAQETCKKWRLRGNEAYTSGDFAKAEECYSRGVDCFPHWEQSVTFSRDLMLCYSNRAATLMSMGRIREALRDCRNAATLDPNFPKVHVRAANCYLSLGDIEGAQGYFKKCMQLVDGLHLDEKFVNEAFAGLAKAQKVAKYKEKSTELLHDRTCDAASKALEMITEALSISHLSENLVEMKVQALLTLRKYEEAIQFCEETLEPAERNAPCVIESCQLKSEDDVVGSETSSPNQWRLEMMARAYYYLGKLEEALNLLEKLEKEGTTVQRCGSKTSESSTSLLVTIRKLLQHKATGNEAFQGGRHSEAIEHYTSAITCNIESRPFAAICFCNRAAAYQALGQITDAIADCSLAIALDSEYPKAISRRATLYEQIRDYTQASNDLRTLICLLEKKLELKSGCSISSNKISTTENDLKQARVRLASVEEEIQRDQPFNMYLILGIESSSTAADIKKAYRKAALRHHPDKAAQYLPWNESGDGLWKEVADKVYKDADRLFKMIGEAYAIISDPDKRYEYDFEEEARNEQKVDKDSPNLYRTSSSDAYYRYQHDNSNERRRWKDSWKSSHSSTSSCRWNESSRSSRYH